MSRIRPFPTVILFFATGCALLGPKAAKPASPSKLDPVALAQAEAAQLNTILSTVKKRDKSNYKIGPADLLEISVFREKDMDRVIRVSQKGSVSFPLVGVIELGGLPVIEAEEKLSSELSKFLVSPQVTIFIKEYGNKQVYVLGEVEKPGSYELPTEAKLTVLEAISMAGGFSKIAAKDRTKVIRGTDDGKSQSFDVEVSAITKRGEKEKDLPLEPNDVVYVPQSFF